MLVEHRGEVEFDFRAILHTSLKRVARADPDELWRLLGLLLRRSDSQLAAAVAGWPRPLSTEAFLLGSLYSTWGGERHPLMPEMKRELAEVDIRVADLALENMNRR